MSSTTEGENAGNQPTTTVAREKMTFEEFLDVLGIKLFDFGPKTFAIGQIEWLKNSLVSFGYWGAKPIVVTRCNKDPNLAGHCPDGRHRLYAIYLLVIAGITIANLQYVRSYKGFKIPEIPTESVSVSTAKDIYGLIARYEELNRSKPESERKERIFSALEGIENQMEANQFTLNKFMDECRAAGYPDTIYVSQYCQKKHPEAQTGTATSSSSSSAAAGQSDAQQKMPPMGNNEWGPLGSQNRGPSTKETMPTALEYTSKRVRCPTCEDDFVAMVKVTKNGRPLDNVDIEIKEQSLVASGQLQA